MVGARLMSLASGLPCLVKWGKSTVRKWFEDLFENVSVAGDRLANFVAGEAENQMFPTI
jgi:hypothetical protein